MRQMLIPYILAYLVGGMIGYFCSEMLLRKTFKVFKSYKGFLVYEAVLSLLLVGINYDIFGYETYIPQDGDIELLMITQHHDSRSDIVLQPENYNAEKHRYMFNSIDFINNPPYKLNDEHIRMLRKYPGVAESREAITKARLIHSYIVENRHTFEQNSRDLNNGLRTAESEDFRHYPIKIAYRLNNGSIVERAYCLVEFEGNPELEKLLSGYLSMPDAREKYEPVLGKTAEDIRFITIDNYKENDRSHLIDDVEGFLEAYQKDILASDPFERIYGYQTGRIPINIIFEFTKGNEFFFYESITSEPLFESYNNTIKYLLENGIVCQEDLEVIPTK